MALNKQALVAAITKYRGDAAMAVKFIGPDFSDDGIERRRHTGVMAARGELLKAMPAEPTTPGVTPASVLADRAPRTADQVAVAQHEFAIVERLLASGQPVEALIPGATPARLDAILAHVEVLPSVLGSASPKSAAAMIESVRDQVFGRLVELGDPKATIPRGPACLRRAGRVARGHQGHDRGPGDRRRSHRAVQRGP